MTIHCLRLNIQHFCCASFSTNEWQRCLFCEHPDNCAMTSAGKLFVYLSNERKHNRSLCWWLFFLDYKQLDLAKVCHYSIERIFVYFASSPRELLKPAIWKVTEMPRTNKTPIPKLTVHCGNLWQVTRKRILKIHRSDRTKTWRQENKGHVQFS